ncbi:MAG: hypothetical protein RG740_01450, partial [Acholeplasmataceae bacterium]|nr:hypothetical protein [Acholeplasmataceae bacterium]
LIALGFITAYYSSTLAFGAMMNRLFIIYITALSLSIFFLIFEISNIKQFEPDKLFRQINITKGMYVFLVVFAASTMIWMFEITNAFLHNRPSDIIGFQATEISFVLDLAIIMPLTIYAIIQLKRKQSIGIIMSICIFVFAIYLGFVVVGQSIAQIVFEYQLNSFEMIIYIMPFILISIISTYFARNIQKQLKSL